MPEISLTLDVLPETLAICRLPPDAPLPDWAVGGGLVSITRTAAELSIVCRAERVPPGVTVVGGWRCLRVAGPLDFALTGVLAALAEPLAQAGISLFAVSTYDTDYLLVPERHLNAAVAALEGAGMRVN